jgi:hypothetical protein
MWYAAQRNVGIKNVSKKECGAQKILRIATAHPHDLKNVEVKKCRNVEMKNNYELRN